MEGQNEGEGDGRARETFQPPLRSKVPSSLPKSLHFHVCDRLPHSFDGWFWFPNH